MVSKFSGSVRLRHIMVCFVKANERTTSIAIFGLLWLDQYIVQLPDQSCRWRNGYSMEIPAAFGMLCFGREGTIYPSAQRVNEIIVAHF